MELENIEAILIPTKQAKSLLSICLKKGEKACKSFYTALQNEDKQLAEELNGQQKCYLNGEDQNACIIMPQKSNKHLNIVSARNSVTCYTFFFTFLHFSVNSLVEDLNKEPESNSVQMAVEETRGHLRAALPLSGDSYFNITQNMTCGKKYTVYG